MIELIHDTLAVIGGLTVVIVGWIAVSVLAVEVNYRWEERKHKRFVKDSGLIPSSKDEE